MAIVKTRTTYLQMFVAPAEVVAAPRPDVRVARAVRLAVDDYRRLYRGVGADLFWVDRLRMPDEELRGILQDDRVAVYVLNVAGEAAGYAELDARTEPDIELAYFGLFPEFIGQGLGRYLLNWALRTAWQAAPRRVWVHTCDLDHPVALPTYQKAGFQVYDERVIDQFVPDKECRGSAPRPDSQP
ncbi:MAG: GNAT family N-acetyltransferase [Pirellulaceae bacterium]|nr:GNAT family N-acetyltransferase [Pirellulaceae bacterium]